MGPDYRYRYKKNLTVAKPDFFEETKTHAIKNLTFNLLFMKVLSKQITQSQCENLSIFQCFHIA